MLSYNFFYEKRGCNYTHIIKPVRAILCKVLLICSNCQKDGLLAIHFELIFSDRDVMISEQFVCKSCRIYDLTILIYY